MAQSKARKVQIGRDNRPGLKKLGQLDLQARQRKKRTAQVDQLAAWIELHKYAAVEVGPGDRAILDILPRKQQWKVAIRALFPGSGA